MSPTNQIYVVFLIELAHYILSKSETNTTVIISIVLDSSLWVWPKQVTQEACVWHISWTDDVLNLVQVFQLWTQTSMHAENFLINQGGHWEGVEDITEYFPKSDRVSTLALIVETINTIDLCTLVVTSEQEEVLWIFDFVAKEQGHSLNRLLASIDIVSKEQIVGLWWETAVFENPQEIVVLSMHVTYTR